MAIVITAQRQDFELIHNSRNILQFMEFVIANAFVEGQDFSLATRRVASIRDLVSSLRDTPRS
jgi:hypothetical protein